MIKNNPASTAALNTCHPELQLLFNTVSKSINITVTEGFRGQEAQNKAVDEGKSKLAWPKGKHNTFPSIAVDVYPYPVEMKNIKRFYWFAGYILGVAQMLRSQGKMKYDVRWGGDWDMDNDLDDQTFNDLVHFELVI